MVALNDSFTTQTNPTTNEEELVPKPQVYDLILWDTVARKGTVSQIPKLTPVERAARENAAGTHHFVPRSLFRRSDVDANLRVISAEHNRAAGNPSQIDFIADRELFKPSRRPLEPMARRILRKHFLTQIVDHLAGLEKHATRPESASDAKKLFTAMRAVRDSLTTDPFSAVVLALHDALAFRNSWARYRPQQYQAAREILVRYGNQDLHEQKALKAIAALEDVGFDTTPFEGLDDQRDSRADEA